MRAPVPTTASACFAICQRHLSLLRYQRRGTRPSQRRSAPTRGGSRPAVLKVLFQNRQRSSWATATQHVSGGNCSKEQRAPLEQQRTAAPQAPRDPEPCRSCAAGARRRARR